MNVYLFPGVYMFDHYHLSLPTGISSPVPNVDFGQQKVGPTFIVLSCTSLYDMVQKGQSENLFSADLKKSERITCPLNLK